MNAQCQRQHPLKRNGTHQDARVPEALSPQTFRIDERSLADLVLFARRYSRHLQYYTRENIADGDWEAFFATDITVTLAGLSKTPVTSFLDFSTGLQNYLTAAPRPDPADMSRHFKLVFHLPFLLIKEIGDFFAAMAETHPLKDYIRQLVVRDLETPIRSLIPYYKGALGSSLFKDTALKRAHYNTTFDTGDDRIQLPTAVMTRIDETAPLSALPIAPALIRDFAPDGWGVFFDALPSDTTPYEGGADAFEKVADALDYHLLVNALGRIYQAVERIAAEADRHLEASLTAFDEHTPHYGLWLAFLQLFANHQDQLNTLTEAHLDHYYKAVLQLCLKAAQPDQVHLLFALTKNVAAHRLAQGTRFKAGKDSTGQEVVYQLDEDFVVNRAGVEALMAVYIERQTVGGGESLRPLASPVANSGDGRGAALPADNPVWKPFGPYEGVADAEIGFAVADRQLFLREGGRTVTVTVKLAAPLPAARAPSSTAFRAALTGEEGWFEISAGAGLAVQYRHPAELTFIITLDGEDPAIVPYAPDLHSGGFATDLPLLKILFAFQGGGDAAVAAFADLREIRFDDIQIQVVVNAARRFSLQNETGLIDTAKPFLPFGPAPKPKAALILGSPELFSKKLESIILKLTWEQAYSARDFFLKTLPDDYKLSFRHLKAGIWQGDRSDYAHQLFGPANLSPYLDATIQTDFEAAGSGRARVAAQTAPTAAVQASVRERPYAPPSNSITLSDLATLSAGQVQTLEDQPYTSTSRTGFIQLTLNTDFGHERYPHEYALAMINSTQTNGHSENNDYNYDANVIPREPYTPRITEIELDYTVSAASPAVLFHLYPFGHVQTAADTGRLMPDLPHQGELYLGIRDLDPPQRLSLLFQCAEGTANPLKEEGAIVWHYLRGNTWVDLPAQDIDDKTANLSGTGIVGIAVPEDADIDHDILPSGRHWLRLAVESDADALNDLIGIDAQAAAATFLDQGNAADFLEAPLPAGTIAKLKISEAAIKTIEQPGESFGGKPPEDGDHFYTRASERLRHKDRAAAVWDYEHLVLEAFPEIYKVKCIGHTELHRDLDSNIIADNELKPGHVLVVTIPYVTETSAVDPLRPYTRKKTLVAIDVFLRQRISPFVRLEVQNPKIEEVQVKFEVAFNAGIADLSFYKEELNLAIRRFLTPWTYGEGADISFGGKWHKSAIINFIEEQPYVDYLKDVEMYHRVDIEQENWRQIDEEVVEATTARSILVSHKAHIINEIEP